MLGSVITATLLLVGCGGGSSSSSTAPASSLAPVSPSANTEKTTGKGYYVDSAVEGINYVCGSQEGVTDENGTFTFESDQNCTFSLAGLRLREINASSLEDNVSILEDNVTVAQLLQTLDSDGNASNGIQISEGTGQVVGDVLVSLDTPLDRDLLEAVHDAIRADTEVEYNGRVVDANETQIHLSSTRQQLELNGRRTQHDVEAEHRASGQFGDNNGSMNGSMNVDTETDGDNNGSMNGSMNVDTETHGDNNGSMNGSMNVGSETHGDTNNGAMSGAMNVGDETETHGDTNNGAMSGAMNTDAETHGDSNATMNVGSEIDGAMSGAMNAGGETDVDSHEAVSGAMNAGAETDVDSHGAVSGAMNTGGKTDVDSHVETETSGAIENSVGSMTGSGETSSSNQNGHASGSLDGGFGR